MRYMVLVFKLPVKRQRQAVKSFYCGVAFFQLQQRVFIKRFIYLMVFMKGCIKAKG